MEIKKVFSHFTTVSDKQYNNIFDEFSAFVKFLEAKVNCDSDSQLKDLYIKKSR